MTTLDLTQAFEQGTALYGGVSKKAVRAMKRAVRKTIRWLTRAALRELSSRTGIRQKTFKAYKRVNFRIGDYQGSVWLGLNPLPLHEAGRVSWSQKRAGVTVRGKLYEGAFFRRVYGSTPKVWVRTARNVSAGLTPYHPPRRWKAQQDPALKGRFPLTLVGMPIDDQAPEIDAALLREAEARFRIIFEQELNYAFNHERG